MAAERPKTLPLITLISLIYTDQESVDVSCAIQNFRELVLFRANFTLFSDPRESVLIRGKNLLFQVSVISC